MNVDRHPIVSVESPDDPRPWYVIEVDEAAGEVVVTEDKDGGRASDLSKARTATPDEVDLPEASNVTASGRVVYAVTDAGEMISYDPLTAEPPSLRAHLGWYDAATDTLTLLDFIE